ncbi:MAG TPA: PqqD family protein [Rikenellaceae bacterium]|nr:PqqD family protein [Rikenellaceae bacterium]
MKIADGFKLREICGEYVVVPEDARLVNFNKMLSLNGTAAFLWKSVCDKEFELDTLADLLVEEYEIDRKIALSDARALLDKWIEIGVIVD